MCGPASNESDALVIITVVLSWSLAHACPLVNHLRGEGYTDEQIEQGARERHVPEWIIRIAKARCIKPVEVN